MVTWILLGSRGRRPQGRRGCSDCAVCGGAFCEYVDGGCGVVVRYVERSAMGETRAMACASIVSGACEGVGWASEPIAAAGEVLRKGRRLV